MTDDEKMAADKEAVKAMIGAMTAMEGAQRRIKSLEAALKGADYILDLIQRNIGEKLKMDTHRDGMWRPTTIHQAAQEYRDMIKKVL